MVDTPPNAPKANIPPLSKVLAAYASESSMKISYPITGWKMAVSFGLFRRAVISQGIEARRVRGQANSAFAEARGWGMVEVWSGALSKAINGQINVDEGGAEGGYSKL
jgi:aminoglycoside phosphotransferase (APT) family kinase protein